MANIPSGFTEEYLLRLLQTGIDTRVSRAYYGIDFARVEGSGATTQALQNLTATEVMRGQEEYINRMLARPAAMDCWWPESKPAKPNPADVKAEELLVSKLSAKQKATWKAEKYFMVTGKTTGVQYKLTTSRTYGIETYLYSRKIGKLCVVAKDKNIPICDQLLAQKLLIETDEEAFIKLANVSA